MIATDSLVFEWSRSGHTLSQICRHLSDDKTQTAQRLTKNVGVKSSIALVNSSLQNVKYQYEGLFLCLCVPQLGRHNVNAHVRGPDQRFAGSVGGRKARIVKPCSVGCDDRKLSGEFSVALLRMASSVLCKTLTFGLYRDGLYIPTTQKIHLYLPAISLGLL